LFASWVDESPVFERCAPVPFSVVCFRLRAGGASDCSDERHARILDRVNASGEIFLSHTKLDGRYAFRLAIGNLHTTAHHVRRAFDLLTAAADATRG